MQSIPKARFLLRSACIPARLCHALILYAALLLTLLPVGTVARANDILVFAAASQRDALEAVITAFEASGADTNVKASYQSSSTLARQIEQGAPADIFISANPLWMDYLQERKLILDATRIDLLSNSLVLVTARKSTVGPVDIRHGFDMAGLPGAGRLAVGDPDHVPAGMYAKAALVTLGAWRTVEGTLARAENTRTALALVARGEAPYGIVYASDAASEKAVKILGRFPEDSHPRIVYPASVVAGTKHPESARAFLAYLRSPEAAKVYRGFGFRVSDAPMN